MLSPRSPVRLIWARARCPKMTAGTAAINGMIPQTIEPIASPLVGWPGTAGGYP
jgi:hypothetical protein